VFPAHLVLILAIFQASSVQPDSAAILRDIHAGKYKEARVEIQEAIKHAPQDARLWSLLGEVDAKTGDTNGAIAALEKARALEPRDATIYFNLGLLFMQKGSMADALKVYSQGLALDPHNEPAIQNYAVLLVHSGKPCEAVAPLRKIKGAKPTDFPARAALIESLWKCGNQAAGKQELAEFLQLPSASSSDRIKLARVLGQDSLLEPAEEALKNVITTSPDFAEAHAELGLLFLQRAQFTDAAYELGRAVQLEPFTARYSLDLAQVLLKEKQYPTALEFLKRVKDRLGNLPEYQYELAWANYGLGYVPQAEALLETLVREHPELDRPRYSLGNCYVALGRLPEAEARYREAIAMNPNNPAYHAALGQVLRKKGPDGLEQAISELETALRLLPTDQDTRVQLAICYEQKSDFSEAERLLESAVGERPEMTEAHRVLARVYYHQGKKEQGDRESATVLKLDAKREARSRPPMGNSSAPESF